MEKGKKQIGIAILLLGISIAIFLLFYLSVGKEELKESGTPLLQGWKITVGGEVYENQNMETFTFPALSKGESIIWENNLPEGIPEISTIRMLTFLSMVEVSVDGKPIYQYGRDNYEMGKMLGSGYHFVQLPRDCEGKSLKVEITSTENKAFTNVLPFELVDSANVYLQVTNENKLSIFVGLFLLLFGFILAGVSSIALLFNTNYLRLVWIGWFSSLMGIWTMCSSKVLQFFCTDIEMTTTMEYIALLFAPIPFFIMVIGTREGIKKWKKQVLYAMVLVLLIFACGSMIFHYTNVIHFPGMITTFHIVAGSSLLLTIVLTLFDQAKMKKAEKILYSGLMLMFLFLIFDLARFNIQKYLFPEKKFLQNSVLPAGTLLFTVCMCTSYVVHLYDMILSKAEKDSLTKLAYRDSLTGLYNRAKCEEIFSKLDEKDTDFAIINFDINGLKKVNDQYGHAEGDLLIQAFGTILVQAFGSIGNIVRMGGDEFLVIVEEKRLDQLERHLEMYRKILEEQGTEMNTKIPLSASFGACVKSSSEVSTAEEVYQIADTKMYDMKGHK